MELIRGLTNLRPRHRGCVVTIGGFDGLHLGHQALIARLHEAARRLGRPTMLVSFEPMPREYLAPEAPPARLTTWRERWRLLGGMQLDNVFLLRFGEDLRRLSGRILPSSSPATWVRRPSSLATISSSAATARRPQKVSPPTARAAVSPSRWSRR